MSFRTNALLAGLTLVAVGLSACGDDDSAPLTVASGGSAGKAGGAGTAGAAGAKAGAAGTTSGGSAGATAGGTGGTSAGASGNAGTTAAGSAGATAGGSAGATAGGSAGASAGGSAGATAGGSAGATAGGSAGQAAGGSAGQAAGGSAGQAAGGSAGAGDAGAAGSAGAAAGSAGAGGSDDGPIPNFAAIALGPGGDIYRFDTNNPGGAGKASAVAAGLGGGALSLVGIDYRPSDGLLYGATNTTLYTLSNALLGNNLTGGGAETFAPNLSDAGQGFDFNPAANISVDGSGNPLRIVGYADASNSRYNPTNGKRLGADTKLTYAANANQPQIAGSAYTNNIKGAADTKLYALDGRNDFLVQQDPPNDGVLKDIAPLGVDVTDAAGFDIVTVVGPDSAVKNYGFAVIGDSLYTVRLTPGTEPAAKLVGKIAGSSQLRGLAVALAPK